MELLHFLVLCLVIILFPDYCQSLGLKVFTLMNIFFAGNIYLILVLLIDIHLGSYEERFFKEIVSIDYD